MYQEIKASGVSYFLVITAIIFIFAAGIIFAITKNSPSSDSDTSNQGAIQSTQDSDLDNLDNTTDDLDTDGLEEEILAEENLSI